MRIDLDAALRDLEEDEEPNVIVDPAFGAFCELRARAEKIRPRTSDRIPLDVILAYMNNAY